MCFRTAAIRLAAGSPYQKWCLTLTYTYYTAFQRLCKYCSQTDNRTNKWIGDLTQTVLQRCSRQFFGRWWREASVPTHSNVSLTAHCRPHRSTSCKALTEGLVHLLIGIFAHQVFVCSPAGHPGATQRASRYQIAILHSKVAQIDSWHTSNAENKYNFIVHNQLND